MNYPLKIGQPRFLTLDEVLTLHTASLDAYGGAHGVLDTGKLEASLGMPEQGFAGDYAHEFPFGMAAAYGFHIAMNHAFRDGNKRTAFASMVAFLRLNGWDFRASDADGAAIVLNLIEFHHDKAWLAEQLHLHSRPRASFELRDFFARVDMQVLMDHASSVTADPKSLLPQLVASMDEACSAIPSLRDIRGYLHQAGAGADHDSRVRAFSQAFLLIALFRLAEDMGYEW